MSYRGLPVLTIEEHYWDPELDEYMSGPSAVRVPRITSRLQDFEDIRLREMDAAGVDLQVLSLTAPSLQNTPPEIAGDLARRANDRLAEIVVRRPDRFAGFAALPTPDPDASVVELERCMRDLGFKGAMVAGLTHGLFLDDPRFHPLLATAERLGAPLYIHPSWAHPDVVRTWFGTDMAEASPLTVQGVWGFTLQTATQAFRLIVSGAMDAYPGLSVVLGHMGEGLPFLLWRINNTYAAEHPDRRSFREVFTSQFSVTCSGFFSTPALQCVIAEIGRDRVMFSIDYPYAPMEPAMAWLNTLEMDDESWAMFLSGNAARLLKIDR